MTENENIINGGAEDVQGAEAEVKTYTADEELFATGMALCTDAEVEGEENEAKKAPRRRTTKARAAKAEEATEAAAE